MYTLTIGKTCINNVYSYYRYVVVLHTPNIFPKKFPNDMSKHMADFNLWMHMNTRWVSYYFREVTNYISVISAFGNKFGNRFGVPSIFLWFLLARPLIICCTLVSFLLFLF